MKNYFYKINQKYIDKFSRNVLLRFKNQDIRTDIVFFKSLFRELNNLFSLIGGRVSSKNDIPKATDYPDSDKYNSLITTIGNDIEKLYTSQKIIEDDVNNLLNFNSTQRTKTYENLTSAQQNVYSAYIKNKKGIKGEIIIPSDNPFNSADNISDEASDIQIDQVRGILTLSHKSEISKPVDLKNVNMYFSAKTPRLPVYPNNITLGLGSHWKIPKKAFHHIDDKDPSASIRYKGMLIDDPGSNTGVGWCEFEAVRTSLSPIEDSYNSRTSYRLTAPGKFQALREPRVVKHDEMEIKNFIGRDSIEDPQSIYLDIPNSLQGKYIDSSNTPPIHEGQQYKLVIPFINANPTNEIKILLESNANNIIPRIVWEDSKVYSNMNGADIAYRLATPSDSKSISEDGEYKCIIQDGYVTPSRLELILEYKADSLHWTRIPFYMSHYVYTASKTYQLEQDSGSKVSLALSKTYNIYVDTEPNEKSERQRALNVLLARGQ